MKMSFTVFPGCIRSHSVVYRAPKKSPANDSFVTLEYRKWAKIISKPTAFGSNNLIYIFTHNLHMQKASEFNKGTDFVVGKELPHQCCFMKLSVYLQYSKKIRFAYSHKCVLKY